MTRRSAGPASDEIGNAIQRLRVEFDLTQQQLADITTVTRKTINRIENGHFVPSAVLALRIASAFGVSVEEVFWLTNPVDPANRPHRSREDPNDTSTPVGTVHDVVV